MIYLFSKKNSEIITDQQNIIFKQLFLTSLFILFFYIILDLINNSTLTAAIISLTVFLIFPFIHYLQKRKKMQFAKSLFLFSVNIIVFLTTIASPEDNWSRIYFMPICLLSFLVLDWTKLYTLLAGVLIPLILYSASVYFQPAISNIFHFEPELNIKTSQYINFVIAYFLLIYLFYHFTEIIKKFQSIYAEQNKFYALGLISAGIAHEVNNPLAIIIGKAELLEKKIKSDSISQDLILSEVLKIKKTSERIAEIILNLKTFSRDNKNDTLQNVSAQKIVAMTLDLCRERLQDRNTQLRFIVENDINIIGTEGQMMQVILNLITNSFDAIEFLDSKWIEILIQNNEIIFTDSGPGIPKKHLDKLMNPFFTTKETGKGVGLGLSLSKAIVESYQGQLIYDTTSPHTRFRIRFPAESSRK